MIPVLVYVWICALAEVFIESHYLTSSLAFLVRSCKPEWLWSIANFLEPPYCWLKIQIIGFKNKLYLGYGCTVPVPTLFATTAAGQLLDCSLNQLHPLAAWSNSLATLPNRPLSYADLVRNAPIFPLLLPLSLRRPGPCPSSIPTLLPMTIWKLPPFGYQLHPFLNYPNLPAHLGPGYQ